MKIWFGEHNGKEVKDLPDRYLAWLADGAMPPIQRRSATPDEKKAARKRWLDLLSEAEDEIFERENDNHT